MVLNFEFEPAGLQGAAADVNRACFPRRAGVVEGIGQGQL